MDWLLSPFTAIESRSYEADALSFSLPLSLSVTFYKQYSKKHRHPDFNKLQFWKQNTASAQDRGFLQRFLNWFHTVSRREIRCIIKSPYFIHAHDRNLHSVRVIVFVNFFSLWQCFQTWLDRTGCQIAQCVAWTVEFCCDVWKGLFLTAWTENGPDRLQMSSITSQIMNDSS